MHASGTWKLQSKKTDFAPPCESSQAKAFFEACTARRTENSWALKRSMDRYSHLWDAVDITTIDTTRTTSIPVVICVCAGYVVMSFDPISQAESSAVMQWLILLAPLRGNKQIQHIGNQFFAGNKWGQRQLDGNWQRILVTGRALAIWFQSFRLGACNSAVTSAWCWQQKLQEENHLPAIWQPSESGKTTEEMTRVKQHLKPSLAKQEVPELVCAGKILIPSLHPARIWQIWQKPWPRFCFRFFFCFLFRCRAAKQDPGTDGRGPQMPQNGVSCGKVKDLTSVLSEISLCILYEFLVALTLL